MKNLMYDFLSKNKQSVIFSKIIFADPVSTAENQRCQHSGKNWQFRKGCTSIQMQRLKSYVEPRNRPGQWKGG